MDFRLLLEALAASSDRLWGDPARISVPPFPLPALTAFGCRLCIGERPACQRQSREGSTSRTPEKAGLPDLTH